MNKRMYLVYALATVLAMVLSSCSAVSYPAGSTIGIPNGQVYELTAESTIYGIVQTLSGVSPNGMIFTKGDNLIMVWSVYGKGIGFYAINLKTFAAANSLENLFRENGLGSIANFKSAEELIKYMKGIGFAQITAIELAAKLGVASSSQVANALHIAVDRAANAPIFIFMFVPGTMTPDKMEKFFNPNYVDPSLPENQS